MKPWARLEQNFINHAKFLALNANAICLWLEGKNYCDMHHTDGLIPKTALRLFRFRSDKAVELLTRSCGPKPNGTAYAPLWEAFDVGGVKYFKMHDYLDHNDCRDEVLARLEDRDDAAELRKLANRERQRAHRAARKQKLAEMRLSHVTSRKTERDRTRDTSTPIETEVEVEVDPSPSETEGRVTRAATAVPPRAGKEPPLSLHLHRFKVWRWMVDECLTVLGSHGADFDLTGFFQDLDRRDNAIIPTVWPWLREEVIAEAKRRGLPMVASDAARSLEPASTWTCPDDPPCEAGTSQWRCHQRHELEQAKRERDTAAAS